jgi:hypothetical protein
VRDGTGKLGGILMSAGEGDEPDCGGASALVHGFRSRTAVLAITCMSTDIDREGSYPHSWFTVPKETSDVLVQVNFVDRE